MANYVINKVICTEEILNNYFLDYYPFGKDTKVEKPYITFNKLFNVNDINEYRERYGTYIYYGFSFSYKKNKDGLFEIKFFTRWYYPIYAIVKSIELFKDSILWYSCEETCCYVSKFYWDNDMVQEEILELQDDYDNWYEKYIFTNIIDCETPDADIWFYKPETKQGWKKCNYNDLISKYFKTYPPEDIYS